MLLPVEQMHSSVGWSGDPPEEWSDYQLVCRGFTWYEVSGLQGPLPHYVRETFKMFLRIEAEAEAEREARWEKQMKGPF